MDLLRFASVIVVVFIISAGNLRSGIVDERPIADPLVHTYPLRVTRAALRPDGQALVVATSTQSGSTAHRLEADGTLIDHVPLLIARTTTEVAATQEGWVLLSAAPGDRSRLSLLDDELTETIVATIEGFPIAVAATSSASYAITKALGKLTLHVIPADGSARARMKLSDVSHEQVQISVWGRDMLVALQEISPGTHPVRLLRVTPSGSIAGAATVPLDAPASGVRIAAGADRALLAVGGDPLDLFWLDPTLEIIDRATIRYAVEGSLRDEPKHLIATSAGFFLSHHQRIDERTERSRMATFSTDGELIEDVYFPPLSIMVANGDRVLASWTPGTIQMGSRDPRYGLGQATAIGGMQGIAGRLEQVVSGEMALVGWQEYVPSGPVLRLTRLSRSGESPEPETLEIPHSNEDWTLVPMGGHRIAVIRLVRQDGAPLLLARTVDLQTMTAGEDVPLPRPAQGSIVAADWNGSDLLIAIATAREIQLVRTDSEFRQIAEPVIFSGNERSEDWISDLVIRRNGDQRALFWSMVWACPFTCIYSPRGGGVVVIDDQEVSDRSFFPGAFDAHASTSFSSGWILAYTDDASWHAGLPITTQSRLARIGPDGSVTWDVPLQRAYHEPIESLSNISGALHLASSSRLAEVEISTPRDAWTASPPSGQWRDPQMVWPDRMIYLGSDPETGVQRPFTARVTSSPATDLVVEIRDAGRIRGGRLLEVIVGNRGAVEATDVHIRTAGGNICENGGMSCGFGFARSEGTIAAGESVRFTFEQRTINSQLRSVIAYVTSSTTDENPLDNASVVESVWIERRKRGVRRDGSRNESSPTHSRDSHP